MVGLGPGKSRCASHPPLPGPSRGRLRAPQRYQRFNGLFSKSSPTLNQSANTSLHPGAYHPLVHEVSQKETLPGLDPEEQVKQLCEAALAADLEAHRMLLEVRKLYCSGQFTRADFLEVRKSLDEARELLSQGRIALHLAPSKLRVKTLEHP